MIPAYVLFLREGLEASMIVSILLAALRQMGQPRDQVRAIWTGTWLAVLVSAAAGAIIYATLREYAGTDFQTKLETGAYLIAVVLLTSMTFWMQRHSRTLKRELTAKAAAAGGSALALGLLAFTTVGREAIESAFFTLAFALRGNGGWLLLGAVLGLATSLGLAVMIYRLGYRLDYRRFFRVMGLLLLIFAAGLLGDAVQNMQALGWLPFGTAHLWNTGAWLSESSTLGDLLHTFVGYAESPTALQAAVYVLFLAIAGGMFARMTRLPGRPGAVVRPGIPSLGPGSGSGEQTHGPMPMQPGAGPALPR
jgi:high-affinity iron transporter